MTVQFFESSHRYKIDGQWATSVTTALKGVPKDFLSRWAAKTVAQHALDNISTLAGDVEHHGYGPTLSLLAGVPDHKRDTAAVRGTAVHALAERYIAGEEIEVSREVMPYVRGYAQYIEDWNPKSIHEELMCANREWKYAGRFDSIQHIPDLGTCMVDYKTSKGVYGTFALQVAAYVNAEFMVVDGVEVPMPKFDRTLVLHIQPETYDLVPVDAGEETFNKFLIAKDNYLANVQSNKLEKLVGDPLVRVVAA